MLKMEQIGKAPANDGTHFDASLTREEKRMFAMEWAQLTRQQKEEWCLRETEDRERYIKEFKAAPRRMNIRARPKRRGPRMAPKRVMTAYMFYVKEHRPRLLREQPEMSF